MLTDNKSLLHYRFYMAFLALTAWFALALQLYLVLQDGPLLGRTTGQQLVLYFTFFTILTNILVAVTFTARSIMPQSIFSSFSLLTAVTLYIVVVGIVYNTVLRGLLTLNGASVIANELLHVIVPSSTLLYWLFTPKQKLPLSSPFKWLWYPSAYLVLALVKGAATNAYPYPFINAAELGYPKVFLNAGAVMVVFLALGFALVGISRLSKPNTQKT